MVLLSMWRHVLAGKGLPQVPGYCAGVPGDMSVGGKALTELVVADSSLFSCIAPKFRGRCFGVLGVPGANNGTRRLHRLSSIRSPTSRGAAMRVFMIVSTIAVILFLTAMPASARLIQNWPYVRLFKEADLVVIAKAGETADTKDRFSTKGWKVEFIGQETQFIAATILKGKLSADEKLMVLHYRLPNGVAIENGPLLVSFRKDGTTLKGTINGNAFKTGIGPPDYLLFLRLGKDGRYEPVSGEIDPVLSIRELHSADGFFSDFGNK
jgi:hypothetical protein